MIRANQIMIEVNRSKDNTKPSSHVKVQLESIGKMMSSRVIALDYVEAAISLVDTLTKGLSGIASTKDVHKTHMSHAVVVTLPCEIRYLK